MNITPGVIEALAALRKADRSVEMRIAVSILEKAGVFAAIDEATCKCPKGFKYHAVNCPEKPGQEQSCPEPPVAESPVSVETPKYTQCHHCRGDYKPKKDGTLRKHNCWRFDQELKTIVFGEQDIHNRRNTDG